MLKTLKRQDDPERRARMYREVASLRTLSTASIAKHVDSNCSDFEGTQELYLVTEYIPGPTLSESTEYKPLNVSSSTAAAIGLLDTIEYCHMRSILHRDIKPDNIILRNGAIFQPVLIDFGLSFNQDGSEHPFQSESGQQIGNRFIQLPEYVTRGGDKHSTVSDLTQLVGVYFFMLTGRNPESLLDDRELLPHDREAAKSIIDLLPADQARHVRELFRVGFRLDMSARFQDIGELRTALRRVMGDVPTRRSFDDRMGEVGRAIAQSRALSLKQRYSHALKLVSSLAPDTCERASKALKHAFHIFVSDHLRDGTKYAIRLGVTYAHASSQPNMTAMIVVTLSGNKARFSCSTSISDVQVFEREVGSTDLEGSNPDQEVKDMVEDCIATLAESIELSRFEN